MRERFIFFIWKMLVPIFLCPYLAAFGANSATAPASLKFNRLSLKEGLSQSIIYAMVQDPRGFIWFATEDGLNRYDGYKFAVIKKRDQDPQSGLSHDNIQTALIDRDGIMWLGTLYGGLTRYDVDRGAFTHYTHDPKDDQSLSSNNIYCLSDGRRGKLWIGTNSGLNSLDKASGKCRAISLPNQKPGQKREIRALFIDKQNTLWIGTEHGELYVKKQNITTCKRFHLSLDKSELKAPPSGKINRIHIDRRDRLWIGSDSGLLRIDHYSAGRSARVIHRYNHHPSIGHSIGHDRVWDILEDKDGTLWFASENGLNRYHAEADRFSVYRANPGDPNSLSISIIRSLFQDRSGLIFIGTYGGGINILNPNKKNFSHYYPVPGNTNSLSQPIVWSIFEDPSNILWIGTQGGGLCRINRADNRYTHYRSSPLTPDGLDNNNIRAIIGDPEGNLWIGSDGGGLFRFDPATKRFDTFKHDPQKENSLSNNRIRALYWENRSALWIGTYGGGLNIMDIRTGDFTKFRHIKNDPRSLSNDIVRSIIKDHRGRVWIGSYGGGISRINAGRKQFFNYLAARNGTYNDFIFVLYEDRQHGLWIGTETGIGKYDIQSDSFKKISIREHPQMKSVFGILEDNRRNLWLSTSHGLVKYNYQSNKSRVYYEHDGLGSNEFNGGAYFISQSGEMFFGGINGFNAFYPNEIADNAFQPAIRLTVFRKRNQVVVSKIPIYAQKKLRLSYRDYFFSFEFASLDYSVPMKNRYAYKLEGLDSEWIQTDASHRIASYTNLSPGKYRFRARGSNSDGIWSKNETSIAIEIEAPPWKSWWAYLIYTSILIFTILQYVQSKRRKLIQKQLELDREKAFSNRLEKEVLLRTEEIENQKRQIEKQADSLKKANRKLSEIANIDSLTEISNRRTFDNVIEREWRRCCRNRKPLSLMLIDIDHFKAYNDAFGHQRGDLCLKTIGVVLFHTLNRAGDLPARYGGEEFAGIMSEIDLKEGIKIAEEVRSRIASLKIKHVIPHPEAGKIVTVSIGLASVIPELKQDYHQLIEAADKALYRSKRTGKNRVTFSRL